jgi:hypothetical protein
MRARDGAQHGEFLQSGKGRRFIRRERSRVVLLASIAPSKSRARNPRTRRPQYS